MPAERSVSDQTVVHHDSWSEEAPPKMEDKVVDEVAVEDANNDEEDKQVQPVEEHQENGHLDNEETRDARERQIDRIEAKIQAAARAVVASIERDEHGGHNDSVLSTQTDESYEDGESRTMKALNLHTGTVRN
jgi:hypothetical protein